MKKILLILLCLPFLFSCKDKEKEKYNKTLSKDLPACIIEDIDNINNKKKEINFLQKEKNYPNNQIEEDSIKKTLLENDVNEQERTAREKLLMKKNNEDIFILR